jgi:hypothetical protein
MISQKNISTNTPMGANLVGRGGATFRARAPLPAAVYLNGTFGGTPRTGQTDDLLLAKDANGYWTGFVDTASEGDLYRSGCWDRLRDQDRPDRTGTKWPERLPQPFSLDQDTNHPGLA